MSRNVFSVIRKLNAAACLRAAVVVPDSLLPSRDPRLLTYLGRSARHPHVAHEIICALTSLGRIPVFAATRTFHPMRSSSFDEARSDLRRLAGLEPFTTHEQWLFDAYATQHLTHKVVQSPTGESRQMRVLNYPLPVTWVFTG